MPEKVLSEKRGPIEIIESKGVRIPIYSGLHHGKESFLLAYYADGQRIRERASSIEEARRQAKAKVQELTSGSAHVSTFSARETAIIQDAVEVLRPTGMPLSQVAREYAEAFAMLKGEGTILEAVKQFVIMREEQRRKGALKAISVPELVEKCMADIRERKKSRRYILDMQARLAIVARSFTGQVLNIEAEDIDLWLSGMKDLSSRTKKNYRSCLTTLFTYAKTKGYLPKGQPTEAELSSRYDDNGGDILTYRPSEMAFLLARIEIRFIPFVAIAGFAGLRTAEICRLDWKDVLWDQGYIELKKGKAKTANRRLVEILPCLKLWLEPFRKTHGPVLEGIRDEFALAKQFKAAVDAIVDETGKRLFKTVHNGFRHSYVTYRMAVLQDEAKVANQAGNSPRMIYQNYRELATKEEGEAWFALTPEACGVKLEAQKKVPTG